MINVKKKKNDKNPSRIVKKKKKKRYEQSPLLPRTTLKFSTRSREKRFRQLRIWETSASVVKEERHVA